MKMFFLLTILLLLNSCSNPETQNIALVPLPVASSTVILSNTPIDSNKPKSLIDSLIAAPKLVHYGEDGARDASVLGLYNIDKNGMTNAPVKEVADIVALREAAVPLLIEHLDDTRPTSATFHGGYLPDSAPRVKVPVGYICLDILLKIVDSKVYAGKLEIESEAELGGGVKDGFYFRPDDYWLLGADGFMVRPIVRIVKTNWQKAYREKRVKYDYKVTWK
jgi:hypothetical protein